MITTAEIHRAAAVQGLRFDQAEKDYVILGVLSALASVGLGDRGWVFKGGTCLRHCYYSGYRFSEDLDFSCSPKTSRMALAISLVQEALRRLESTLGLSVALKEAKASEGEEQIELPLEYSRGGGRVRGLPTLKFHLTFDEPVLTPPVTREVRPIYSDLQPFTLEAYSLSEIVAEKLRALLQQQEKWPRPRDLYDLWFILCHRKEQLGAGELLELFRQKCMIRGVVPELSGISSIPLREWNHQAWESQLRPMLTHPPDYDVVWADWTAFVKTHFLSK